MSVQELKAKLKALRAEVRKVAKELKKAENDESIDDAAVERYYETQYERHFHSCEMG